MLRRWWHRRRCPLCRNETRLFRETLQEHWESRSYGVGKAILGGETIIWKLSSVPTPGAATPPSASPDVSPGFGPRPFPGQVSRSASSKSGKDTHGDG